MSLKKISNFYRVNKFGVHQKGEYGFCDENCSTSQDEKEKRMEDEHDPVVFEEELPIILNNPL